MNEIIANYYSEQNCTEILKIVGFEEISYYSKMLHERNNQEIKHLFNNQKIYFRNKMSIFHLASLA